MGIIQVTAATTGSDWDEDGYVVLLDGAAKPSGEVQPNGTLAVTGMASGSHQVRLAGFAQNCTVEGPNPRTVEVTFGETTTASFAVTCGAVGRVQVAITTSGSPADPDGYIVRAEQGGSFAASVHGPASGAPTVRLMSGSYSFSLLGVAANCSIVAPPDASMSNVDVVPGATITITFAVTCQAVPSTQLAFVRGGRIYKVNADGSGLIQLTDGPADADPTWSPDGRRIAFTRKDPGGGETRDTYVMDADGSNVRLLTEVRDSGRPEWSPDGREIALSSTCDGRGCIQVVDADGNGSDAIRLEVHPGGGLTWSPDGSAIAFASADEESSDVFVTTRDGWQITQLTRTTKYTWFAQPVWSPDGRRLAVVIETCERGCTSAIAVMNADGSGQTTLASGSVRSPTWSPDGRTIAFSVHFNEQASIEWVSVDGSEGGGVLIADGHSPSWRR